MRVTSMKRVFLYLLEPELPDPDPEDPLEDDDPPLRPPLPPLPPLPDEPPPPLLFSKSLRRDASKRSASGAETSSASSFKSRRGRARSRFGNVREWTADVLASRSVSAD